MRRGAPLVLLAILAAGSCVAPARSFDAYESKAVDSAESALSQARAAILTAELTHRGRLFAPLVSVQLQEAEVGAETAASTFASVQPPDTPSDALRGELLPLLERAATLIADLRIEARRDDLAEVARGSAPLEPVADRLERFVAEHR
jgi:hypothetical protein